MKVNVFDIIPIVKPNQTIEKHPIVPFTVEIPVDEDVNTAIAKHLREKYGIERAVFDWERI